MAVSTYKGYTLMATGTETNNWGNVQNNEQMTYIDRNLGGFVSKALTNVNVTLSATESQNAILRLTGTLTGNVIITTACLGFFFVENATTGSFTVTVRNNLIATSAVAPQGTRVVMISDSANGVRQAATGDFPSGTSMPFFQTAAPTGWTKSTAHNNKALRIVSGTASDGGLSPFTSVFAARTILSTNLPNFNVGVTITDPGHTHPYVKPSASSNIYGGGAVGAVPGFSADNTNSNTTGITASGIFGNTQRGGVQQTINFDVQYVDVIAAIKN